MIDPKRPVKVICTGRPNPAAMRALEDYLIDRAIERAAKAAQCTAQAQDDAPVMEVTHERSVA